MKPAIVRRWEFFVSTGDSDAIDSFLKFFLGAASFIYGLGMRLRNWGYDEKILAVRKARVPVVSIGNLSLGGTGKTQMVIWCAEKLQGLGKKTAVLSRGYRRNDIEETTVVSNESEILVSPDEAGDEPYMIAKSVPGLPVIVGASRSQAAQAAMERFSPDVFLLDDAFQHRKFHRDLDVACLDEKMLDAPKIFPAGFMREDVRSLSRAHFVLIKTNNEELFTAQFRKKFLFFPDQPSAVFTYMPKLLRDHALGSIVQISALSRRPVYAFSGIANPRDFERLLKENGADLIALRTFPDHHRFSISELQSMVDEAKERNALLVTTEKDRMRIPKDVPVWSLEVAIKWLRGEEEFLKVLFKAAGA